VVAGFARRPNRKPKVTFLRLLGVVRTIRVQPLLVSRRTGVGIIGFDLRSGHAAPRQSPVSRHTSLNRAVGKLCFRRFSHPPTQLRFPFLSEDCPINTAPVGTPREFRFYLPASYGDRVQIRGTFTGYEWRAMDAPTAEPAEWTFCAAEVDHGDQYSFRFRSAVTGAWIESTDPVAGRYTQNFDLATNRHDLYAVVPRLATVPQAPPPVMTNGLRVCECTLPGLAARWPGIKANGGGGKSLAARLLGSGLANRLRERNYSAIMLPIQASAADVLHYNWKFGYLITGLGAIHAQLGDWDELRALIAEFHSAGVLVIPDLILVHYADQSSDRAPYTIRGPGDQMLWFDHQANRPVDFGTYMLRWDDAYVRRQVVEMLVRFVEELGLGAYRFDFVDGVIRQYESRPTNYGAMLLEEMSNRLQERGLQAWSLSEAFATREHPAVLRFADVLYQPWVGFDCMKAALTTPDDGTAWRFNKVREGLIGATGSRQPKPTLGYALAHDEAGRDEGVMHNHRNDRGETVSVGGHLAQLVLDYAKRLPEGLAPSPQDRVEFVADRVALIEGTALLGADFASLTLGDFSDYLKLGSYDDLDGWQMVWSVDSHPDLDRWIAETGLASNVIASQIGRHADRMSRLRKLFAEHTTIGADPLRPIVALEVLGHNGDGSVVAWARHTPTQLDKSLLVVANFSHAAHEHLELQLHYNLPASWIVADASQATDKTPSIGAAFTTDVHHRLSLRLSANTLIVLRAS